MNTCPVCGSEAQVRKPLHSNYYKISCPDECGHYGVTLLALMKLRSLPDARHERLHAQLIAATRDDYRIDVCVDAKGRIATQRGEKRVWTGRL